MKYPFFCFKEKNYFSHAQHTHKSIEICYTPTGNVEHLFGDSTHSLKKNEFIIFDASRPHQLFITQEGACAIGFEIPWDFSETSAKYKGKRQVFAKDGSMLEKLIIEDIVEKYYKGMSLNECSQAIEYFLSLMSQKSIDTSVSNIKHYVNDNYQSDLSLDALSEKFHISKVHLQRIFKTETGITIGDFVRNVRMQKSLYYLKNTDIRVEEIHMYTGMHSHQAFYKAFKKLYGMSPSEYRTASQQIK